MKIDIHLHVHDDPQIERVLIELKNLYLSVHHLKEIIVMNQAELAAALAALNTTVDSISTGVDHVGTETTALVQEVADLKAAVQAGGVTTPEVDAALQAVQDRVASLATKVQAVDDLVPDATPTP